MRDGTSEGVDWERLAALGVKVPRLARATTADDAARFFDELGGARVAVKAQTDLHKAAAGLVCLHLDTHEAVRAAFHEVHARASRLGLSTTLLVQELIPPGPEALIGLTRDPAFGPVIAVGIGGRLVEAIGRAAIRFAPLTAADAAAAVSEVGLDGLHLDAAAKDLADMLVAIGELALAEPQLMELDLNPVILGETGACAVDLRTRFDTTRAVDTRPDRPADQAATRAAIHAMISPASVAVVGASADPSKPGGRVLRLVASHAPTVRRHPVNPRGGTIDGEPVHRSLDDVPDDVDVAVFATPAGTLPDAIRAAGRRGVHSGVVFASGFRETGNAALEDEVRHAAIQSGVRLCGVNSMGLLGDAPLTFSQALNAEPVDGDVSFLTQSGAIGGSLLIGAWSQGLGTARFISVGNETDLAVADYLDYLSHDERTSTIGIFLEGVRDGGAFREALRTAARNGRRVVVLHAGTSPAGAASVRTHTGALAGSAAVYAQALAEAGAVAVSDIGELLGTCQAISWQPPARGRRVAVLSTSGGGCSLVADHLSDVGLAVPPLDPATRAAVSAELPAFAATSNPIDTTGNISSDPGLLRRIVDPVLASEAIDAAIVAVSALIGASADHIVQSIIDSAARTDKPIVVTWMVPESAIGPACDRLRAHKIPVFTSVRAACVALAALAPPADRLAQGAVL